jgi:hypothetical protein
MKRPILHLLLLAALPGSSAMGQVISCTSGPAVGKLVCEFPFSTGVLANASALGSSSSSASGAASAQTVATTINIGIATQLSQLPLASASAGTIEVYKAGVPETFNNLGPILTDRAQVIGKGKVFIGFTGSQYVFTKIDGIPLSSLTFSYSQNAYSQGSNPTLISTTYTSENTALSFRMNQLVGVATVGLSNRVDVSVIIPIERVSLGASTSNSKSYVQNAGSTTAIGPSSNPSIYAAGTASGIGDINFNVKGVLWNGERDTVSSGFTLRTPTGDDLNFLGSGAWGFNLYALYSHLAKVSPHAKVGYQWNTTTELNNPTLSFGKNQSLPGGMQYDVGADWAAAKHMTVAADILGSQYLNTPIYVPTKSAPINVATSATTPATSQDLPSSTIENSSYNVSDLSAGVKINPLRDLVLSANVLIQLNDNGLHARPTPLLGISCKF